MNALLPAPVVRNQRPGLVLEVLADFVAILLAFTISSSVVPVIERLIHPLATPFRHLWLPVPAFGLWLLYGAVFTLLGYCEHLYEPETSRSPRKERAVLGKAAILSSLLLGGTLAWPGIRLVSGLATFAGVPLSFVAMIGWREWRHRRTAHGTRGGNPARNVLIIGSGKLGRKLARHLQQDPVRRRLVRGFLDENQPVGGDIRGRAGDFSRVVRSEFIDEIILTISPHSDIARRIIWEARLNRIDVKLVPDLLGFNPSQVTLETLGDIPVLTLSEEPIPVFGLLLKRAIDVTFSGTGIVLLLPFLAAIALAIKLDSSGAILYRAPRLGFKGCRFLCWKFRTMVTGADQGQDRLRDHNQRTGAFFKLANDPRITRLGRMLRRYSLDELPQLWNVLRGDMSLVGPRPHPLADFKRYDLEDWQRLEVLPGITGLWQVTARQDPSFERSMALDRQYIQHWTLGMDMGILRKTVAVVFRGEGC